MKVLKIFLQTPSIWKVTGSEYIDSTGPLVAYLNRRDPWHLWVSKQMGIVTDSLITCEAVISESCFLLEREGLAPAPIFKMMRLNVLQIKPVIEEETAQEYVAEILNTYDNLPASFADACLVHMTETSREAHIFTLDNDFFIYRNSKGDPLELIHPRK